MKYKIELIKRKRQWYVRLRFKNGKIFMHSEKYTKLCHAKRVSLDLFRAMPGAVFKVLFGPQ